MAVQTEIWVRYIINRLWKDNQFLKYTFNDDQYVVGGKIVHIPNPGSKPTVVKNRAAFPAIAVQRADLDITYTLDRYSTDPTQIEAADLQEITYDKISSVFGDHAGQLVETVADDMIIKWLTGIAAIITTSGGATGALVAGQTGTRKVLLNGDLKKAKLQMDLQKVPAADRYAMLEANRMDELLSDLSVTQYRDFSDQMDAANGIIGKLYGFNIMSRSNVAIASAGNAISALGAAVGATDNVVSIAWHKDSITRAIGEKRFFENKDDAFNYGDVYSALLRAGGRRRRSDDAGVIAIVSAP